LSLVPGKQTKLHSVVPTLESAFYRQSHGTPFSKGLSYLSDKDGLYMRTYGTSYSTARLHLTLNYFINPKGVISQYSTFIEVFYEIFKIINAVITPFPKCIEGHDFLTSKPCYVTLQVPLHKSIAFCQAQRSTYLTPPV
jgi:hypothetical protein